MLAKKSPKGGKKKKRSIEYERDHGKIKEIVPKHKHCVNCGVSIPPEKETCSDRCKLEWDKMVKRKKYWVYIPYIIAAILMLFLLFYLSNG